MKKIDGFTLKIIAIIAMLINHIGGGFAPWIIPQSVGMYEATLWIGRLTFPIMAFMVAEGFHYTRNKWKYLGRMALFWGISIYPFYLLFHSTSREFQLVDLVNNIFFTLMIGLLLIIICDMVQLIWLEIPLAFLFALLTYFSDWGFMGVLTIYGFYRIKNDFLRKTVPIIYTCAIFFYQMYTELYLVNPLGYPMGIIMTAWGGLLVIPLLLMYNGKRGYSPAWMKWGFYLFYPVHLVLLVVIRNIFFL
ncbi:TraX family protein [Enterococcus sp. HY326]|uniref:TraX family protein n=1 Tax=Enterococcus sp. HY326 TaxID=2971265 RepID=UPI0022402F4C|nr:TraX family protein [Enterococcus sp. HY326]